MQNYLHGLKNKYQVSGVRYQVGMSEPETWHLEPKTFFNIYSSTELPTEL
jgi:hypothetical protein